VTHVSLFSGIGGLDLAAEWAGFETVLQVERDPYCLRVLAKHWPSVPRITDIHEVTADERWTRPTVLSGGFPCQPHSVAGKRKGTEDDRFLWPAMLDCIRALVPRWVVAENVPGLLSQESGMVFESVCSDLERAGYEVQPLVVPAAGVGAPHLRYRVFVVAYAVGNPDRRDCRGFVLPGHDGEREAGSSGRSENVAHAEVQPERPGLRQDEPARERGRRLGVGGCATGADTGCALLEKRGGPEGERAFSAVRGGRWWSIEPNVGRVAHGVPHRVDRLRALGNAVVPQQAAPIFQAIAAVERSRLPLPSLDPPRPRPDGRLDSGGLLIRENIPPGDLLDSEPGGSILHRTDGAPPPGGDVL